MDLRQLEIIRAIADTGSFTAAGEKLHVSQSAISRQILLLEEELGEPVFHRIGRRIRITPAGESLLQLSHRVFRDLQETVSTISDKREALSGTMRLVGGMTVCLYVFPALLAEVRRVHPHLDMKVTVGSAERSIAMLRSGAGDLGMITLPVEATDLVSVPVLEEELLLITYPAHPLAKKKSIAPADLDKQDFVLFETGSITGFFTVWVEGDDFNEPICDAARGILDGHFILSRQLGAQGHYPAIDILHSVSRLTSAIATPAQKEAGRKVRGALAAYRDAEDLIQLGAYVSGSNAALDASIRLRPELIDYLRQDAHAVSPINETLSRLVELAGRLDMLPAAGGANRR